MTKLMQELDQELALELRMMYLTRLDHVKDMLRRDPVELAAALDRLRRLGIALGIVSTFGERSICSRCGSVKPLDQSCGCFDNNCE